MREKNEIRVFFALWPDEALRRRLFLAGSAVALERPARRVPEYNLHLTLHFIGNVERDALPCLRAQALLAKGRAFDLSVDRRGYFSKPRVAWLGCNQVPAELQQLHRDLGQCLALCGFRPEKRIYNPHLTVARKIQREPVLPDFEAIKWSVDNFVLVESKAVDNGVKYEVVETYPLA